MKKATLVLVLLALLAGFAAAKPTEITFWYALSGAGGEVFKKLVDAYNAAQTDVAVKGVFSGKYADTAEKVTAAMAAKTLPHGGVIPAGPIFTGAQGNYVLLDLMNADRSFDQGDFYPGMWEYSKFQGKICAIPYNISTPMLYYNKKLMTEAGLDPAKPPTTWAELQSSAAKIAKDKNGDGTPDVWGFDTSDTPWIFKAFLLQNGCQIIDTATLTPLFDKPEGVETATFWRRLIDAKVMAVGLHGNSERMFLGGTLGFYMGTSSRIGTWTGQTSFELGAAALPAGKKRAVPIGGAVLVLFPHSKAEDEACYKFIKWLTQPVNVGTFSVGTGYLPTRKSAVKLPEVQSFLNTSPMYRAAFEQLEYSSSYWHFNEMGTMDSLIAEALEKIERGVLTPQAAMQELTKGLKAEIDANK